jgi:hypothetical protein
LGRPAHKWEDNIKMDLNEVGWGRVWAGFIWLSIRAMNTFINLRVPENAEKLLAS